jgi:hypothetical protein
MAQKEEICGTCRFARTIVPNAILPALVVCLRYPVAVTKKSGDWCGEFLVNPAAEKKTKQTVIKK